MQKINFLPQVKIWNAAEFHSRNVWQNSVLGSFTYDGSVNKFAVTLQGKDGPEWKYLLTSNQYDTSAVTSVRMQSELGSYFDIIAGETGVLSIYTKSLYNDTSNRLATMLDVSNAVATIPVVGLNMDSSAVHIDSSYIHLKSDSSYPYLDSGDAQGSEVNPLATVGTVNALRIDVSNAISALGDLFTLEHVYDASFIEEESLTDFASLLNYIQTTSPSIFNDYKKGSVLIFGKEEWVLINPDSPSNPSSWELLGTIDSPNAYVTSFGGQTGAITISDSFFMNGKQLVLETASDTSLGGVMTGHTTGKDGSTYIFDLKVGGKNAADASRGYVTIPIVTGAEGDASYGLVPNTALIGDTHIYTVNINPSTCGNLSGTQYNEIKSIKLTYDNIINSDDLIVSVYKVRAGQGGSERLGRQLVYVDEIISGPHNLLVDFGSAEAFIGCQDTMGDAYLGYVVVISASANSINIDASTTFVPNVDPDQPTT